MGSAGEQGGSVARRQRSGAGVGVQMRRASRRDFSVEKQVLFFTALAETANVTTAAKAAGVSTMTIWRRRKSDAEFRQAWAQALEHGYADLEMRLLGIARDGKTTDTVSEGRGEGRRVRRTRTDVPAFGLRLLDGYRAEVAAGRMIDAPEVRSIDRSELVEKVRIALQIVSERRTAERAAAESEDPAVPATESDDGAA